ncbi:MAG: hypothetical protein V1644_01115, partial [Candidatus Micrarchaeota archaeon]
DRIIWPVFLITILDTVANTGFVVTVSMLVSLLLFYYIGKITDKYDKLKILRLSTFLYFFGWLGRIFVNAPLTVFLVDSYKHTAEKVLQVPWSAKCCDIAIKEDYFEFIVAREIIFNLSRVIVLPFLMLIFYVNFFAFTISFIIAALFSLGYMFLAKR